MDTHELNTYFDALKIIADKHKNLTAAGFHDSRESDFAQRREDLLHDVDGFRLACEWIRTQRRSVKVNPTISSYGWKRHLPRYCTNGAFIAAAIHEGLTMKTRQGSLNAWVNLRGGDNRKMAA
jgi:hypothetical protein